MRLCAAMYLGMLFTAFMLSSAFSTATDVSKEGIIRLMASNDQLQKDALNILETKCNVCHKKQHPFMVFKEKNISKRASNIYNMVFVERRMPRGNDIKLTNEEYNTLEKWLFTQQIF